MLPSSLPFLSLVWDRRFLMFWLYRTLGCQVLSVRRIYPIFFENRMKKWKPTRLTEPKTQPKHSTKKYKNTYALFLHQKPYFLYLWFIKCKTLKTTNRDSQSRIYRKVFSAFLNFSPRMTLNKLDKNFSSNLWKYFSFVEPKSSLWSFWIFSKETLFSYHENLEKRGGCAVVAHERHESRYSQ